MPPLKPQQILVKPELVWLETSHRIKDEVSVKEQMW
jgi:hypothetical protein